jgi:Lon protease-like protein
MEATTNAKAEVAVEEVREQRFAVERWVNAQPQCPTRKQAVAQFPDAPQRIVRAAVQSRMDRERR